MTTGTLRQIGSAITTVILVLAVLGPVNGFAAQEPPDATPTPGRAPSYQPVTPGDTLRLPGPAPDVGEVIAEDALNAPGMIPGRSMCSSGKAVSEFVGEGYILKVAGRCRTESTQAAIHLSAIPGLDVPDGEIRIEAKVVNGGTRTAFWLLTREQMDRFLRYNLAVTPAAGVVNLYLESANQPPSRLAGRADLRDRIGDGDWHAYAIRLDGPRLWVLVDDELVLSVADGTTDRGGVALGLRRLGDVEDDAEAAVVFRNLRISRLAAKSSP